ncbi:MAG TPA: amidohydrolase family protein [Bacteroidia bacterium]|nr:amidohydrolase family protein [Bacteroidia bacterium]HNT80181.1 amidohydrolase family protein [Bacteroidia bacterium]
MKNCFALIALLIIPLLTYSQKEETKWNVNEAPGPFSETEIVTAEGTWMNVDVHPSGTEIVFDLLGDIYTLPINGGKAKIIREGLAFEVQPRYSPDGTKILFTSDAGGGDNIWMMNKDGSNPKQITKENFRLLNNAVWMPDGNYIVARKHFTSTRSLGAGELWMYHTNGGEGIQLTKRKNDQQDLNEPSVSSDAKFIYYSEDVYPGGYFQYNKDPNNQIYVVKRYNTEEGTTEIVTGGGGSAFRPQISPDGKQLAFIRRVHTKTVLFIHELSSGLEYPVFDQLSKDQIEAWAIFGTYTGFSWMPNGKEIIIWANGKINRIDIAKRSVQNIPFEAVSKHKITNAIHHKNEAFTDSVQCYVLRHATTSPDQNILVFNAVGHLYKSDLQNGKTQRVTKKNSLEFEPAFNQNGSKLVYVTWSDSDLGSIQLLDLKSQKSITLNSEKGIYRTPSFSPDGKRICYQKESGNDHLGFDYTKNTGIYIINIDGKQEKLISKHGSQPFFNKDASRIYFTTREGDKKALKSIDLNGHDEKIHFSSKYATEFSISPDEKWIAFVELFNVYVCPFPAAGQNIELSSGMKSLPVARLSNQAGKNIHWSANSKTIHYTLGNEYYSLDLSSRFAFLPESPDSIAPVTEIKGQTINLKLKADKPSGKLALSGARIITMRGEEVIENGVMLINENIIESVGPKSEVNIPEGYTSIDVSGKTIMPGMVDVHSHLGTFRQGLSPEKQWSYFANLAYGVTTTHDPSSNTEMVFAQSEMVKTGVMIGPRVFSTGTILYGAEGDFKAIINSLEDAKNAIDRTKAYGAFSVKSYNQPRRDQRQQVIKAARESNTIVVPEGGSFFYHNLSMILDGHTGIEHNIPVAPLYNDVIKLWSASTTFNTPTLIVCYGGVNGEYYFYERDNVYENKRLLNFTPRFVIDERSRHRTKVPSEEYENGFVLVSKSLKKLNDAGVKINLGSHGQLQGLGAHWELWMLQMGGMSNWEALKCATLNGAEYIGMSHQIGSLEKGKLADLIVLNKNPLENIRNTESIQYTMINGRIYDAETMNEVGNYNNKRSKFYWENNAYGSEFEWHLHSGGHGDED